MKKWKMVHWMAMVAVIVASGGGVQAALFDNEIVLGEHDGPFYGGGFNNDDRATFHDFISGTYTDVGSVVGIANGGWQVSGASVGDINNDGDNEVALTYQYNDGTGAFVSVYDYTNNGVWTSLWGQSISSGGWGVQGVGIGNADNSPDGSKELVLGWHYGMRNNYENDVVVAYRFGGASITELFRGPSWSGGWNITGVGVGDSDNDGDNEVVLSWSFYEYQTQINSGDTLHICDFTGGAFQESSSRWDIRLASDDWDTTGLDVGDADNDGVNEIAVSWRKFGQTEQGARLELYNYANNALTLESTPFLDATANWGIHGVGIGNADNVIVPEPATIGLLLAGGLLLQRKR